MDDLNLLLLQKIEEMQKEIEALKQQQNPKEEVSEVLPFGGDVKEEEVVKKKVYDKRIPKGGVFMKKSTNDWLYCYLQSISYVDKDGTTFVYRDDVVLTQIAPLMPLNEKGRATTPRTLNNHLRTLEAIGLVKRGNVKSIQGETIKNAYILPWEKYVEGDKSTLYELIPQETLKYLVKTLSIHCIKVYIYLLDKAKWKEKHNQFYNFTSKELIQDCLGIKGTHQRDYETIIFVLDALIKFKLIEIEREYKTFDGQLTSQWKLTNVHKHIKIDQQLIKK